MRLGFFVAVDGGYRLDIPQQVTLASVKRAALDMLSVAKDDRDGIEVLQPERLLQTLPKAEAKAQRSIMMAMRRFRMITASKNRSC